MRGEVDKREKKRTRGGRREGKRGCPTTFWSQIHPGYLSLRVRSRVLCILHDALHCTTHGQHTDKGSHSSLLGTPRVTTQALHICLPFLVFCSVGGRGHCTILSSIFSFRYCFMFCSIWSTLRPVFVFFHSCIPTAPQVFQ